MTNRLEDVWSHEDIKGYDPYRERFRPASAELVREVFRESLPKQGRVLEIGSGLGELVKLSPEVRDRIQQTEQNTRIAAENKRLNTQSNIHIANVYQLPYRDGSFVAVVGYSVLDTLADLEAALRESGRVLIPNGKLIHFLDIQASLNTYLHKYSTGEFIPFPLVEKLENDKTALCGLQLVRKQDYLRIQPTLLPQQRPLFDLFVANPEQLFYLADMEPKLKEGLYYLSDDVSKLPIEKRVIRFNENFRDDLEAALSNTGYILDKNLSGRRRGAVIVEANDAHKKFPQYNIHHNDIGVDMSRHDPQVAKELGPGQVKVISDHYVTVAHKQ